MQAAVLSLWNGYVLVSKGELHIQSHVTLRYRNHGEPVTI